MMLDDLILDFPQLLVDFQTFYEKLMFGQSYV